MVNFFKNFGKGVLYVLVTPFLLVGLALYGVGALFVFLFLAVKGLILFFTGRSLYEDLPEDKEAKRRLAGASTTSQESNVQITPTTNNSINEQPMDGNQSADPFYVPEYLKTDEMKEEMTEEQPLTTPKEQPDQEQLFEETNHSQVNNLPEDNVNEDVITVQKNPQNETIIKISDIDEDDDNDSSGINIDYE